MFSGRTSTGVRGIRLADGQKIVSMTTLNHIELETDVRDSYLRMSKARRRQEGDDEENSVDETAESETEGSSHVTLSEEEFSRLADTEEFILSVTENGYGKRTSAYEYRITKRGGQGVVNITTEGRNGPVVASFPVEDSDQIMLVTNGGKIIRSPVADIRIAGRSTQGVTLFDTAEDEQVVSVAHLKETDDEEDHPEGEDAGEPIEGEESPAAVGADDDDAVGEVDDAAGDA